MSTTAHHGAKTRRAGIALAAVVVAAVLLAGCSNSTGPDVTPDTEVHYFARTAPDSVIANLMLAYENQHLTHYLDCLAEDFTFYPSEITLAQNEWIPDSWGRSDEELIHRNMFGTSSFVRDILVALLQEGEATAIPGPNPGDPVSYEYTFGVDLRVDCQDSIQYVATAPSLFLLCVDPDEVGATGEPLWEILQWYDIDDGSCARPVLPTTWGELKALFLGIDWD